MLQGPLALCRFQARVKKEGWWWGADTATVKNRWWKSNGRWRRVIGKTQRYGRRRERQWTPTGLKAQDTKALPNSLETHLARKWGDIGHLWVLSPWNNGWIDLSVNHVLSMNHLSWKLTWNHSNVPVAMGLEQGVIYPTGVNPGGLGVASPQILGWGVARGSWTGLGILL